MKSAFRTLAAVALATAAGVAIAQGFPVPGKTIRVIVPFTAGSGTDVTTRILVEDLQKGMGVPMIVENKPGANGTLAAEYVSKQAPDGYTLLIGTSSAFSANPWLLKKLPYDPLKDFTPIARTTDFPFFLAVSGSSPVKNLDDFLQFVRSAPKLALGYGNATGQVANAHLMNDARFSAVSVAYKSTPPALVDMVGGQFDAMFVDIASSQGLVKDGKVRAIAVMSDRRSALMPGLPALGEKVPGFNYIAWGGLIGPPGMPADIVERLNAEMVRTLNKPAIKEKFAAVGQDPFPSTAAEFAAFMVDQKAAWGAKIQAAGIEPQ
ncbi:MAG: tripartite tricarboxylate transporter substrate binding protein [Variovorax sp.]|nr:tripartite tricarboxylate transporter substrate binding protein [Variovorax sp.]